MLVKFISPMAGKDVLYNTKDTYELSKKQAERFIEHKICVEFVEEETKSQKKAEEKVVSLEKEIKVVKAAVLKKDNEFKIQKKSLDAVKKDVINKDKEIKKLKAKK